jgi:hypothetical protein
MKPSRDEKCNVTFKFEHHHLSSISHFTFTTTWKIQPQAFKINSVTVLITQHDTDLTQQVTITL